MQFTILWVFTDIPIQNNENLPIQRRSSPFQKPRSYCLLSEVFTSAATSENVPSVTCAQREFRSACAFVQSDQNIHLAKDAKYLHVDRQKTYFRSYAASADSDQPANLYCLIRIFTWQLHVDNNESDKTALMRRLIWVLVERTCQKVRFLTLRLNC